MKRHINEKLHILYLTVNACEAYALNLLSGVLFDNGNRERTRQRLGEQFDAGLTL